MLPWVVEAAVGRLRGGPLAWQLATRRLQLNSSAVGAHGQRRDGRGGRGDRPPDALQRRQQRLRQQHRRRSDPRAGRGRRPGQQRPPGARRHRAARRHQGRHRRLRLRLLAGHPAGRRHAGPPARRPPTCRSRSATARRCGRWRAITGCAPGSVFLVRHTGDDPETDDFDRYARPGHALDLNVPYGTRTTRAGPGCGRSRPAPRRSAPVPTRPATGSGACSPLRRPSTPGS